MPRQSDLARAAGLHQSRISMFETPGAANMTLETLARLAAAFKVGLVVKFVPFSEMLRWENEYSQDSFEVTPIEKDIEFQNPESSGQQLSNMGMNQANTSPRWSVGVGTGAMSLERKPPMATVGGGSTTALLAGQNG
jgi:transcriptional regulator with XRE-family HTH domain